MNIDEAILLIRQELERAEKLHPKWPKDMIHAAAIVSEESGELVRACNNCQYFEENSFPMDINKLNDFRKDVTIEAIQTGAMALRFLINM